MFNVRVYGILFDESGSILVSDELIRGKKYTKFCGGGLELGEGTKACLIREFQEEMGLRIEVLNHVYTTDFYQQSAFNPNHQIISIYYEVKALEPIAISLKTKAFDFEEHHILQHEKTGQAEVFLFIPWEEFGPDSLSLPIDKVVAIQIKKENGLL